jgi:butyryl-CoA dehydrogenase
VRTAEAPLVEPLQLLYELSDFDRFPLATLLMEAKPKIYEQCLSIQRRVRDFSERHLCRNVDRWDELAAQDHDFVPWPAIDAGLEHGFLSMNIPEVFGGQSLGRIPAALFAEELSVTDAGIFVIYGAHGLALSAVFASLDMRMIQRLGREISDGERAGKAVLLALAHTEPGGGSDVEDVDDLRRAHLTSRFTKVAGGYRINARKLFISNGSFARYNVVTAFGDPKRPLETTCGFLLRNDTPGFSVGRVEHKMGQRLCAAAEIICDDAFVPDSDAFAFTDTARMIDTVLSITRGPVGAMATGIMRGAIERTLRYLAQKRVRGHWLFEEQWVQLALAEMVAAVQAGRGLYMDAALAGDAWGLPNPEVRLPDAVARSKIFSRVVTHPKIIEGARQRYSTTVPTEQLQRVVAHSSLAKFFCSDLAVRMCGKAMEILGEDANDPTWGVEKCMRDAKLGQIFEGTNQINRLHVTRGLVQRR